jgi:DUF2934 family protein
MTDRDDRVREVAYFLWLEEGCPEGQAERHWRDAQAIVEAGPIERKRIEGEPPGEPAEDLPASGVSAAPPILRRGGRSGNDR